MCPLGREGPSVDTRWFPIGYLVLYAETSTEEAASKAEETSKEVSPKAEEGELTEVTVEDDY